VLFCRDQWLFRARLVALDGSKFRAAASPSRSWAGGIAEEAARLDRRIAEYLAGLEERRPRARWAPNATAGALETRRVELDRMAAARSRPKSPAPGLKERPTPARWASARGRRPSYNVQTAVDADTGLIVHHAVTNEPNDTRQLHPMPKAAKEALGFERLTVVADAGYSNGAAAAACEVDGITACAPANRGTNSQGDGALFDRSAFAYQPEADVYVCPTGRALAPKQPMRRDSLILCAASDCSDCSLKPRCATAKRRSVTRHRTRRRSNR
jgi:hypothetical protein